MAKAPFYHARIMEFYNKKNRYYGMIKHPDFCATQKNVSCGDELMLTGTLEHGNISTIKFVGDGCIISQAAAVMLIEYCIGKSIKHVLNFSCKDMEKLFGVPLGPGRMPCVLLALETLQYALRDVKNYD